MKRWNDYLRAARDELLRGGELVFTDGIVDRAMKMPGGEDAFRAEAEGNAHRKALRDASKLLSAAGHASDDEQLGTLFSMLPYDPPRALTLPLADGRVAHKAVEYGTRGDNNVHAGVLESHATAAINKAREFNAFRTDMATEQHDADTTNGDVMRARRDRREAA